MASAATLAIKLAGEDAGAEKALEHTARKLGEVEHAAKPAGDSLSHFGGEAEGAGRKAGEAEPHFAKLRESLADVGKVAAGMVAGNILSSLGRGIGDQFKDGIDDAQHYGEAVRLVAMQTGATAEQASGLMFAFKEQNVDADLAAKSLVKFAKGLQGVEDQQDKTIPGSKTTLEVMKGLGINVDDATGKIRPLNDVLLDVADKFKEMPDGTEKTARAVQLFGRAGAGLLPVLNLGREGIEESEAAAKKYGLTLSADNVAQIHKFAMAHKEMDGAIEGVRLKLATAAMPVLTSLIGLLTSGVTHVIDFMNGLKLGEKLGPIFDVLGGVFGKIADMVKAIASGDASSFFLAMTQGLEKVGGIGGNFKPLVDTITSFVFGTIPQAIGKFRDFAAALGSAFDKLTHGDIAGALASIGPALGKMLGSVGDMRKGLIEKLAGWASAFLEWIEPMLPPLLKKLLDLAGRILAWIEEQAPIYLKQLGQWTMQFIAWAQKMVPPLLVKLGEMFDMIMTWLSAQAPPLMQKLVGEWIPAFLGWLIEIIPPLLLKLGELLLAITTWIVTTAVPKLLEFALKMGEALVKGLVEALKPLADELGKAIRDALNSIHIDVGPFHLSAAGFSIDMSGMTGALGGIAAHVPGFAGGTGYHYGGLAVIGENGPELVNLPRGSSVTPSGGGMGGGLVLNFNAPIYGVDDMQETVMGAVVQAVRTGRLSTTVMGN